MHETYAAIHTPASKWERGFRGSVRCVMGGEVARCTHQHPTRSAAVACGERMLAEVATCPEVD